MSVRLSFSPKVNLFYLRRKEWENVSCTCHRTGEVSLFQHPTIHFKFGRSSYDPRATRIKGGRNIIQQCYGQHYKNWQYHWGSGQKGGGKTEEGVVIWAQEETRIFEVSGTKNHSEEAGQTADTGWMLNGVAVPEGNSGKTQRPTNTVEIILLSSFPYRSVVRIPFSFLVAADPRWMVRLRVLLIVVSFADTHQVGSLPIWAWLLRTLALRQVTMKTASVYYVD